MLISENKYLIFDRAQKPGLKRTMKHCRNILLRMLYSVRIHIYKPAEVKTTKKYKVSVLAIFKNEAKYLKEWIEFHKIVGVEHFYLYNNNSEDNYLSVLKPYIDEGTVTLVQWPKNQAQMESYQDGITRFKSESEWIGIIDIDEFVIPNDMDNVYDFLKDFNCPAVVIYWKYFGASGRIDRRKTGLVAEDFTVSWRKYADIGKCFFNTKYDIDFSDKKNGSFHHFLWANYRGKRIPPKNAFGKVCLPEYHPIPHTADITHFPIQINHYFTKSYNEYLEKKSKGDVYFKVNPHTLDYFYRHDKKGQSVDYHAYKYLIKLKLGMEKETKD